MGLREAVPQKESDKYKAAAVLGTGAALGSAAAAHHAVHRIGRSKPEGGYTKPAPWQFRQLLDPRKGRPVPGKTRAKGAALWAGSALTHRVAAPVAGAGITGLVMTRPAKRERTPTSLTERAKEGAARLFDDQEDAPRLDSKTKRELAAGVLVGSTAGAGAHAAAADALMRRRDPQRWKDLKAGKVLPRKSRAVGAAAAGIAGTAAGLQIAGRRAERRNPGYEMTPTGLRRRKATVRKSEADDRRAALTGSGAVLAGTGLVGGGIPGTKANRITLDVSNALKEKKPVKAAAELARARRGGLFGYRDNAHSTELNFNLSDEGIKRQYPGSGTKDTFGRAMQEGKRTPEKTIIRHLKRGRKGSYGLLGTGGVLMLAGRGRSPAERRQSKQGSPAPVRKAERTPEEKRRRAIALASGGATVGVGGELLGRGLNRESRKWSERAAGGFDEAQRLVPAVGGHTNRKGHVRAEVKNKDIANNAEEIFRGKSKNTVKEVGRLRGAAANHAYFGHVYGTMGRLTRRIAVPAGLATAGVGGLGVHRQNTRRELASKSLRMPEMVEFSKYTADGMSNAERKEMAHRKKVQAGLSSATALGTIGSTGMLLAGVAGHKLPKKLGGKLLANPETRKKLERNAYRSSMGVAGMGATSGLYFSAAQRKEAKQLTQKMFAEAYEVEKSLFRVRNTPLRPKRPPRFGMARPKGMSRRSTVSRSYVASRRGASGPPRAYSARGSVT